jgi:phosphopantothenoylcysteine decarboxylase/phosphopantothenate--cysteine ligase
MSSITLIISGSIAAIKAPELIRQLRAKQIDVRCIVTASGQQFVSLAEIETLSGHPVSTDLFSKKEMDEMWHIRFSRETDLIVVAPASANLIAKMAQGIADDMATATLLANNKRLIVAPAMNTYMWMHPATQRNVKQIMADGAEIIEPREGLLACGEVGAGRMAEPEDIVKVVVSRISSPRRVEVRRGAFSVQSIDTSEQASPLPNPPPAGEGKLKGMRALVTSGPTFEAIDPVRFIGNRSSGKQGHAIAAELARCGAEVTLVAGPTMLPDPPGVKTIHVTSAVEMLKACEKSLPADIAVCVAAVSDWRVKTPAKQKIKKGKTKVPALKLVENPDILHHLSHAKKRPKLVIGFAAETENLLKNAAAKRKKKGCDWIVANDVSGKKGFDAEENQVVLITAEGNQKWPKMSKDRVAEKLVERILCHSREGGNPGHATKKKRK